MRPQSSPGRAATSSACRPHLPLPACALTTGHASVVPTRLHTATKADRLREVASGSPASARTRSPVLCVRASRSIACVPRRATSRSSSRRLLCRRFRATRRSTSGGALSTRGSTSQAARRCAGPATRDECAEQHDVRRLPRRDDNARRTSSRNFTLRDCAETAQTAKPVELASAHAGADQRRPVAAGGLICPAGIVTVVHLPAVTVAWVRRPRSLPARGCSQ
jgi:hypothetical protein